MSTPIDARAMAILFKEARSHNKWQDKPVSVDQLREVYELMKWGPTSANAFPLRIHFVRTPQGKARLLPLVLEGNREKVRTAPAVAILAYDTQFYDWLPRLFPHRDMRPIFAGNAALCEITGFRNSSLQAAYFIIACRAVGLDCGPMSGFDNAAVDKEFFPGGTIKSNIVCGVGYGDPAGLYPRSPRPTFDEVCRVE